MYSKFKNYSDIDQYECFDWSKSSSGYVWMRGGGGVMSHVISLIIRK